MAFSEACSYVSRKDHIEDEEEYAKRENILHVWLTLRWQGSQFFKQNKASKTFP